jgi:hypothetical protein
VISRKCIVGLTTAVFLAAYLPTSAQELGCGTVVPQTQIDLERRQMAAGIDYSQLKTARPSVTVGLTISGGPARPCDHIVTKQV